MIVFFLVILGWTALSFLAAPLVGRSVHLADEQSEAERAAAMERHPSGRWTA